MSEKINIKGIEQIDDAAREFLRRKPANPGVALYGEMGAGKTTFTKALCRVLGVVDGVNSPTFTLINEYRTENDDTIYHFDFYRIEKLEEAFDIGFEEFIYSGNLCLIEWPEKIGQLLPEKHVKVLVEAPDSSERRTFTIEMMPKNVI